MSYSSKIFLKAYVLLACCAVFSLSCEIPSPTQSNGEKELPSPSQPKGGNTPLRSSCKVSHTETSDSNQSQEKIIPQNEPLFHKQWYLCNTNGIDINIVPVWEKGYGTKSISIGILDSAIDILHPDLTDSVLVEGFGPYNSSQSHGTSVAGLLAARDNGTGIIGVAPRAKIYSYGFSSINDKAVIQMLKHQKHRTIAVYNASFGTTASGYRELPPLLEEAFDTVTEDGFHGKGSNLVWAAGNGGASFKNSASHDYFLNHHAVIAVNSLPQDGIVSTFEIGSTKGVNIWITVPSGKPRKSFPHLDKMITTYNEEKYGHLGNTSAAAPLVSGAIALLRSEYRDLTWRDVKLILAESAKKHDEGDVEYRKSGIKYSDARTQYHDRKMGFGLLDVAKAFEIAENWEPLPKMKEHTATKATALSITSHKEHTSTLTVHASDIQFIESVTLEMNVEAMEKSKGIKIRTLKLIDPDRKESFIFKRPNNISRLGIHQIDSISSEKITFVVNSFVGSSAVGIWTLSIQQFENWDNTIEEITEWNLTFRGH